MLSVILCAVFAAGASGSSPAPSQWMTMGVSVEATTAPLEPLATLEAPKGGTATRLHWEVLSSGTDNGEGPDSFTLAVTADGTPICSASIACTTASGSGATCTGDFTEGQDLHVEVTASDCATLPAMRGSATLRL